MKIKVLTSHLEFNFAIKIFTLVEYFWNFGMEFYMKFNFIPPGDVFTLLSTLHHQTSKAFWMLKHHCNDFKPLLWPIARFSTTWWLLSEIAF